MDDKMEKELRKLNPNLKSFEDIPIIYAFVVFDDIKDQHKAMKLFSRHKLFSKK
jgi:hypothetical protein